MGQCFPLVRGRVMRATRLDACGRIQSAAVGSIATDGFVSVALTANIEAGEAVTVVNAAGRTCVNDAAVPTFNGYGVAITFCDVNPELYAMMTNQAVIFDTAGLAVGFRVNSKVDISKANFGLEVWSNVPGVACDPTGAGAYGYTLLPFISGGILGDFTIENGAVSFTLQNANTKDGTGWGTGPYNVVNGVGGTAGKLLTPLDANDHLHVQYTTIAPPAASCTPTASGVKSTGATSGTPGSVTPVDSYPPPNFASLSTTHVLTASPATAWTTGQYIVLGDGTFANWSGTAWVAGKKP